MKYRDWVLCGYKDAQEKEPYKRSPSPNPPELPNEYLPEEWQAYFEGWNAGVKDGAARIMRNTKEKTMLIQARQVAQDVGVRMIHNRKKETIQFRFPSGRLIEVWFPREGRTNNLHIKDLQEIIDLLKSEEGKSL